MTEIDDLRQQMFDIEHALNKDPFERSEGFREFVVWLCGFTDRSEPPNMEDWEKLQHKTKVMAAQFALDARNRKKHAPPEQLSLFPNTASASGYALSASVNPVFAATSGLDGSKTYTYKELIS